jgi:aldehyde:ferredoxin oxidoreductase
MDGKPELMKKGSDANTLLECLGVCSSTLSPFFGPITLTQTAQAVRLATGLDLDLQDLMRTAERVNTLRRAYLIKQGFTTADDILPPRFQEALHGGPSDGQKISAEEFARAKEEFYELSGWDKAGVPRKAALKEQNLEWVAADLAALDLLRD